MQLAARDNGWAQFVAMENHYNLLYREDEHELIPICRQMNVSLIPYSPLAAGHLTRPEWNSDSIRSKTDRAAMGNMTGLRNRIWKSSAGFIVWQKNMA